MGETEQTAGGGAEATPPDGSDGERARSRRSTILVVDDDSVNRRLIAAQLQSEGHRIVEARDGAEALVSMTHSLPDLVLLDVRMPGIDGYEVVRRMKKLPATRAIPVVLITALADLEARARGLEVGAEEFLTKPVERSELVVRVRNLLRLKLYADQLSDQNRLLESKVQERTRELRASHIETIVTLSRAAEYKDEETGAHVKRISHYTRELALTLGRDEEFAEMMFYASPMHDVGKIGIPDHILLKRGTLTPVEWSVMKSHTTVGYEILRHGNTPLMQLGAEIALAHHERWDGSGYPNGWKGEQIPISARIMSISDCYDALRRRRPNREPIDHAAALAILMQGDERTQPEHFDPHVLTAFLRQASRWEEIFGTLPD